MLAPVWFAFQLQWEWEHTLICCTYSSRAVAAGTSLLPLSPLCFSVCLSFKCLVFPSCPMLEQIHDRRVTHWWGIYRNMQVILDYSVRRAFLFSFPKTWATFWCARLIVCLISLRVNSICLSLQHNEAISLTTVPAAPLNILQLTVRLLELEGFCSSAVNKRQIIPGYIGEGLPRIFWWLWKSTCVILGSVWLCLYSVLSHWALMSPLRLN